MTEEEVPTTYEVTRRVVRDDATPIDNVTKFAWDENDFIEVTEVFDYTPEEIEQMTNAIKNNIENRLQEYEEVISTLKSALPWVFK